MNKIRVAQIMGKMMSGGVESVVMNYYRHIDKSKVQFDFIVDEDSTIVPYEEIESLGGKIHKIPPYQNPIAYHFELVRLFRENSYHIVHSHINTLSVFPLFAAKRAGVLVRIAHSHSTAGKGEPARNVLKYMFRPFSRVFPTHYCACSAHAGRWLFRKKLYESGKIMLVRNAIDLSKFKFDAQIREDIRHELNIVCQFAIIHIGRFMAQKNHSFLIDIFEQIQSRRSNSVLLLVGEGELEQEIREKVNRLGLSGCVKFLGVRSDVHKLLMAADIFILPSNYEGLGMVAIEAQAVGLKIIASDMVPSEAQVTQSFSCIPLSQPAQIWAEEVLLSIPVDRKPPISHIIDTGYEIESAADSLLNFYHKGIFSRDE